MVVSAATRWIGAVVVAVLLIGGAAAQEMLPFDPDNLDLPNESTMPGGSEELPSMGRSDMAEPSVLAGPPQVATPYNGEAYDEAYDTGKPGYEVWDSQPAVITSTGTWLNRGIWYAEADGVALLRTWERQDMFLVAEDSRVNISTQIQQFGLALDTNRTVWLPSSHPGEDAAVRTTLGRFLFRDDDNRDHSLEFSAYTNGDWVEDCQLASQTANGLFTPFPVSGTNRDFDNSSQQRILYSSRLNSFEINYRVKRRLGRDQMVMDPNGCWRREASNGFNRNYLIGFRFFELRDTLDWTAQDIAVTGADGRYLINTDNNLFGFQIGEGIEYETGRWSFNVGAKVGLFINDADARSQLTFTADDTDDFDRHTTEDELSFLGEANIMARYHLTPSLSLRTGLEFEVLDSLALAPRQINFINDYSKIETGGSPFYMGGSLGVDMYW